MKQKVDDNNEKAVVNHDEREQSRILKLICREFQVVWKSIIKVLIKYVQTGFETKNDQPLSYWDYVLSDSFAETIENMFYFSFLLKLEVIEFWFSKDYEQLVFVPNFDIIDESKFGLRKEAQKNKKRNISV